MIYVSVMNLFNSISDELLITIQLCTILICLYAIILFMLFRNKNKLINKGKFFLRLINIRIFILFLISVDYLISIKELLFLYIYTYKKCHQEHLR